MGVTLLDVNALIALLWQPHIFHQRMMRWFASPENEGWSTCPITEQGFVRILSNPSYTRPATKIKSAIEFLTQAKQAAKNCEFWPDDLPISALSPTLRSRIQGHNQLTDAYLLTLAVKHGGRLITFDYRMRSLAPVGTPEGDALLLLRA